jgi:signal transduction histidine kinase/ActR/RegA family two-component response regulator
VVHDGATLGLVYLEALTEPIAQRMWRHVGIGLLVIMAALLVMLLGLAQAALARANTELEQRAVDLDTANRDLRAQIAEREKAEDALRHSQKMEALGQLTGGVAHDFNNLMTVVSGNLDLIDRLAETAPDGGVPPDGLRRLVAAAQRGLARGARLTRQLLVLSRREPLESRIVDVNAMITDFAPLIQRAVGEVIDLRLQLGVGRWLCKLDPAQFETAVLNLAINARDATEGAGSLTIATTLADGGEAGGAPGEQQLLLTVGDTGSGMPPEVLLRVFEPFYTTKPVGKGSGLGLAQVWAFVNQSGGRIEVDSGPGEGTTFRLYLPLSSEPPDRLATEDAISAGPGGSERVLVVEDEEDVREVAAATLERLGYRTVVARDGREALTILDEDDDFDLLFTDYVMPNGISGVELAHAARRLLPRLRILVTSGYAGQAAAGPGGLRIEGLPLLAKPYRSADLAVRIREVFDQAPAEAAAARPG